MIKHFHTTGAYRKRVFKWLIRGGRYSEPFVMRDIKIYTDIPLHTHQKGFGRLTVTGVEGMEQLKFP